MFRFVFSLVRSREKAQDITQETFVRAYTNRETIRELNKIVSWLMQVARRLVIDEARKSKWEVSVDLTDTEVSPVAPDAIKPLNAALDIDKGMIALNEGDREIIALRFKAQLSFEEIAETLDIGVSAAKMRTKRAFERLSEEMKARRCDGNGH